MATCSRCSRLVPDVEPRQTTEGPLCRECGFGIPNLAQPSPMKVPLSPVVIVGAIAGALPYFFHFTTSSSFTVDDEVVRASTRDFVAIGGGLVAAVCGGIAVIAAVKAKDERGPRIGLAMGVLVLALFQLVRGFGLG